MQTMMTWERLVCNKRLGMENYTDNRSRIRSDFQRDYDRLIFSSPFHRLQNKTQVFPLPGSVFVHNRLTHSLEVAGVGRSIASEVASMLMPKYRDTHWAEHKLGSLGEIVAAAGLAHDLGNPPFGHSGEKCINSYFAEGNGMALRERLTTEQWNDLIHFEGNANSFRLLTHQFVGRRNGGLSMTYSTLATIVKYPFSSSFASHGGKFGFFISEREYYQRIATELGIIQFSEQQYARHPLVYLMEAADDICYQVMDIEDAHKLKVLDHDKTISLLLGFFTAERCVHICNVMSRIGDGNEQIAYLRSCAIDELVRSCARVFVENEPSILQGTFQGSLVDHIDELAHNGYAKCSETAFSKIYNQSTVVDIELAGDRIITFLLDKLLDAVLYPDKNYSKLLLSRVPQQYDVHSLELFTRIQAVIDYISGMTDLYAIDLYSKLSGIHLPQI